MAKLRYVFASGSHCEALALVHSQRSYVMNHHGHRPPGREETGGMVGSVTTRAEALELCHRHQPELLITTDQLEAIKDVVRKGEESDCHVFLVDGYA